MRTIRCMQLLPPSPGACSGSVCKREQAIVAGRNTPGGITKAEAIKIGWFERSEGDWRCPFHSGTRSPS